MIVIKNILPKNSKRFSKKVMIFRRLADSREKNNLEKIPYYISKD
jgi:hypothetical protein